MIAVDTNVVVRLLVRDDAKQAEAAAVLFARGPVGLSATVLLETAWVLRSGYRLAPAAVVDALRPVLLLGFGLSDDLPLGRADARPRARTGRSRPRACPGARW